MGFYDLPKPERQNLVNKISADLLADFSNNTLNSIRYFADDDTYIRKTAYVAAGRHFRDKPLLGPVIILQLEKLITHADDKVRQTAMNAAGEIAKFDFGMVSHFFDTGLFDVHHSVRNAVIGSVKKAGEVNPEPVLKWATGYLHHPFPEVRREICHGIELRGRKYPEDILPLLQQLEFDKSPRVYNTLVHVIGQIAYKKGCLLKVLNHLKQWKNKAIVEKALVEIVVIHERYKNFSALTAQQAQTIIDAEMYS